jgi:hypothetical protein
MRDRSLEPARREVEEAKRVVGIWKAKYVTCSLLILMKKVKHWAVEEEDELLGCLRRLNEKMMEKKMWIVDRDGLVI